MSAPELTELDPETFGATLVEPMRDVTRNPHAAIAIDLWAYVEPALDRHFPAQGTDRWDVQAVLQNAKGTHQHVVIGAPRGDPRLVVVLALEEAAIVGHVVVTPDGLAQFEA